MKELKRRIIHFFSFFKVSNLKREVERLGFALSLKNLFVIVALFLFATFIAHFLLRLEWIYCTVLFTFLFLCMPSMIIAKFKSDYERNRFNDTVDYMEQVIYSFHKSSKIRNTLADVYSVSKGTIKSTIKKMLDCIDFDMSTPNLYEKAFDIMQNEYNCSRMLLLHNYLIEVEKNGGKSDRSLNVLLDDIRSWAERVLVYQQERKSIKGKITLSIFLAMLSCGIMTRLVPAEYSDQIVAMKVYQFGTLFVLLGCVWLYVYASNRIGVSYLDFEVDVNVSKRALEAAEYVANYDKVNHKKKAIIMTAIFVFPIGACIYFQLYPILWLCIFLWLGFVSTDVRRKYDSVSRIVHEINKMFPAWIRSLVLHLQTENVHIAIKKSFKTCPDILKPEVKKFLVNLDKDPVGIRPYVDFLKDFNVPNLRMSVHYLYAISQFGSEDMLAQLDYLIDQNAKLAITEEKLRNEDALTGFSLLVLFPMFLAVVKLIIDLVLLMNVFMTYMMNAGSVW